MDGVRKAYEEEVHKALRDLETSLIDLDGSPEDREIVNHVFRALYSVIGSASSLRRVRGLLETGNERRTWEDGTRGEEILAVFRDLMRELYRRRFF